MALYVRWRYLNIPFERDEGEYAYGAQVILGGGELYHNVYSLKWPGIFLIYSMIIGALGSSIWAVHLGLLMVNVATAYLIYRTLVRVVASTPSLMGAVSFLVFMIQKELQGIFANIEHFVVFFIALAVYKLIVYWENNQQRDLLRAGIFCGLALITKQQAIGFILAILVSILFEHFNDRREWRGMLAKVTVFGFGVVAPVLVVFGWIALFDDFQRFWFHTWIYATEYVGIVSLEDGWFELRKRIIENFTINPWLWGTAITGGLFIYRSQIEKPIRFLLIALFIGAFMATSFGLYYRPHYVMFMPLVLSLLIGVFYDIIYRIRPWIPVALFVIAIIYYGYKDSAYLFRWSPQQAVSKIYHWEPFAATVAIGEHLRDISQADDQILVVGSEPQINFYAGKKTPTGYLYAYPLVEDQKYSEQMFEEWLSEATETSPQFIVAMGEWTTYAKWNEGFYKIWNASQAYISDGYSLIGIITVAQDNSYTEKWGSDLKVPEKIEGQLFVYKKR